MMAILSATSPLVSGLGRLTFELLLGLSVEFEEFLELFQPRLPCFLLDSLLRLASYGFTHYF